MSLDVCHVCDGTRLLNMGPVNAGGGNVTELCTFCGCAQRAAIGAAQRREQNRIALHQSFDLMPDNPVMDPIDD